MTDSRDDPAIARRLLMDRLLEFRAKAKLTREQAAGALEWSMSKMIRIETAAQGVSSTDLQAMLALYKVTDESVVDQMKELARETRRPAWWSGYRDMLTKPFSQMLSLEGVASSVGVFHPYLVPGVLHTAEYASALFRETGKPENEARPLVDLRMRRKDRMFARAGESEICFVFGEEALTREIGGAAVLRGQLGHLIQVIDSGSVAVQVVPTSLGGYAGLAGAFTLLGLRETDENLLFVESAVGDFSRRDEVTIEAFKNIFEGLRETALSVSNSRELINRRWDSLR